MADLHASALASVDFPARRTAQELVAERLRMEILGGFLRPGQRLGYKELATRMRTSTTPVREAIRELAVDGLLDIDPHRGVLVHTPSLDELHDIYEIRELLEPLAVSAMCKNLTEDELSRADQMVREMADTADFGMWATLNFRFHTFLSQAARRPRLIGLLAQLRNVSSLYVARFIAAMPDHIERHNQEHRELLDALKTRNVHRAVQAELGHLRHVLELGEAQLPAQGC